MAHGASRTITYNGDNVPAHITVDGNTVGFVYGGSGVRAKKTVNQTDATYYIGKYYEKRIGVVTKYIFSGKEQLGVFGEGLSGRAGLAGLAFG